VPGANPTFASYNASVVNFYNATGTLARFENKNIIFYILKRSSLLQRWRCSCKSKSRRIGSWIRTHASPFHLLQGALEEELEIYKESLERVETKHSEAVSRILATFEVKEKSWLKKELSLENDVEHVQAKLDAANRRVRLPIILLVGPTRFFSQQHANNATVLVCLRENLTSWRDKSL
jgi:hypothetical protein